jgi:hypothetical protein
LNRGLSYHFPEEGGKVRSICSEKCGVDGLLLSPKEKIKNVSKPKGVFTFVSNI